MSEPSDSLREQFRDIDVYLFDQRLRGRIASGLKVLDVGCGSGWYVRCGECSRRAACSSLG